jgi:N-formylglutamate deformylase
MKPFEVHRPAGDAVLLYDSPHSGRHYPPEFAMGAPMREMRRGEDAYVDELLLPSVAEGAVLLAGNYPRCFIDVNRAVTDLDQAQLSEPWPGTLQPTEKSQRGLGLIRRLVIPGVNAQRGPLTVVEVKRRIEGVYVPYHQALDDLVAEMLRDRGSVVHVDWHSMKSVGNAMTPDGPGARRPDFVVSDGRGTTADPALTTAIAAALTDQGYRVAINDPYQGGTIVKRIGNPAGGVHSVQIEISRALYLDEVRVEKTEGFGGLAESLRRFTRTMSSVVRSRFGR